jgi:polysaccharide export outer membrane protein
MTVNEANDSILTRARLYFNQPFVNFLFISFKITVLGEVKMPGVKSIKSENATLTEAIAESGDLTEVANRKKIKVIRGDSVFYLDITDMNVMKSKAYFLQSNDIIYIQPLKKKNIMSNFTTTATFLGVLTFLTSVTSAFLYLTR